MKSQSHYLSLVIAILVLMASVSGVPAHAETETAEPVAPIRKTIEPQRARIETRAIEQKEKIENRAIEQKEKIENRASTTMMRIENRAVEQKERMENRASTTMMRIENRASTTEARMDKRQEAAEMLKRKQEEALERRKEMRDEIRDARNKKLIEQAERIVKRAETMLANLNDVASRLEKRISEASLKHPMNNARAALTEAQGKIAIAKEDVVAAHLAINTIVDKASSLEMASSTNGVGAVEKDAFKLAVRKSDESLKEANKALAEVTKVLRDDLRKSLTATSSPIVPGTPVTGTSTATSTATSTTN